MDFNENAIYFFIIVGIIYLIVFQPTIHLKYFNFNSNKINYVPSDKEKNELTNHLNEIGLFYYYSESCYYCKEQNKHINFTLFQNKVNVSNQNLKPLVTGVPAFELNNEIVVGVQTYNQLKNKYGY